jgi:hypothetical protein
MYMRAGLLVFFFIYSGWGVIWASVGMQQKKAAQYVVKLGLLCWLAAAYCMLQLLLALAISVF